MTSPAWSPVTPGSGVFFPGDRIRAGLVECVIEDFSRDLHALTWGEPGDTAHVRLATGELALIPVAAITAVTAVAVEAAAFDEAVT